MNGILQHYTYWTNSNESWAVNRAESFATVAIAVSAVAEILDTVRPGWERFVDLGSLDMSKPRTCVLGRVFGGWSAGLKALNSKHSWTDMRAVATSAGTEAYWQHQIKKRLGVVSHE